MARPDDTNPANNHALPVVVSAEQKRLVDESVFHFLAVRRYHRSHGELIPVVTPVLLQTWISEFLAIAVPTELIIHVLARWVAAGHLERAPAGPALSPELEYFRPRATSPDTFEYVPTLELMGKLDRARELGWTELEFASPPNTPEVVPFQFPDLSFAFTAERAVRVSVRIARGQGGEITFFQVKAASGARLTLDEQALIVLAATGVQQALADLPMARDALIASARRRKKGKPSTTNAQRDLRGARGTAVSLRRELAKILAKLPFLFMMDETSIRPGPGLRLVRVFESGVDGERRVAPDDFLRSVSSTLSPRRQSGHGDIPAVTG